MWKPVSNLPLYRAFYLPLPWVKITTKRIYTMTFKYPRFSRGGSLCQGSYSMIACKVDFTLQVRKVRRRGRLGILLAAPHPQPQSARSSVLNSQMRAPKPRPSASTPDCLHRVSAQKNGSVHTQLCGRGLRDPGERCRARMEKQGRKLD